MKRLSPRQVQIARLVAQARTDRQIAGLLGLSEQTVKNQLQRAYRKLGAHSRVALAVAVVDGRPEAAHG